MVYSRVTDSCDCSQRIRSHRNINPDKARRMMVEIFGQDEGLDMMDHLEENCPELFGNKNQRYGNSRYQNTLQDQYYLPRSGDSDQSYERIIDEFLGNEDEYYYDNYADSTAPVRIRADKHPKKHIHSQGPIVDNLDFVNEALKGKAQDDIVSIDKETGVIKTKEAMGDNWEKQIIDAKKETSTKTRNIDQGFLERAWQFTKGAVKGFPPVALLFYGTEGYKDMIDSISDGYNYEHEYYEKGMKEPIKATGRTEQEAIENAIKLREQYRLEKETNDFNF